MIKAIIMVAALLVILFLVPFIIEYFLSKTVRANRKNKILGLALKKSQSTGKAIIYFDHNDGAYIIDLDNTTALCDDIYTILANIPDDSCIIVACEILEYSDNLEKLIVDMHRVSGGDLYCINFEKISTKKMYDCAVLNIMNDSYNIPDDEIGWTLPSDIQCGIQNLYDQIQKKLIY